ncbi:hypothetical protein N7513_001900 [Penicillium frequentans]|nr:hypothetical protein N7513_001900 [Penicillium glabrum]
MVLCVPCERSFSHSTCFGTAPPVPKALVRDLQQNFQVRWLKKQHTKSSKNHLDQANCDVIRNNHPSATMNIRRMGSHQTSAMKISMRNDYSTPAYTGVPRNMVTPVFKMACRLRFMKPDTNVLLSYIDTQLDHMIISALIEAALRLLPPDDTPGGRLEAKEIMQQKMERAYLQEVAFVNQVRDFGYQILTEKEQRESQLRSTPDIRFLEPILIDGHLCHWIEFKNYFGFKSNPFIASKNKKQLNRYASEIGPGAVVYKLGFEIDHIVIAGIHSFREAEVLHLLEQQSKIRN